MTQPQCPQRIKPCNSAEPSRGAPCAWSRTCPKSHGVLVQSFLVGQVLFPTYIGGIRVSLHMQPIAHRSVSEGLGLFTRYLPRMIYFRAAIHECSCIGGIAHNFVDHPISRGFPEKLS